MVLTNDNYSKIILFSRHVNFTFAQKMQQEAEKRGLDFDVKAYGLAEVDSEGPKADVIMIGPQARYMVDEVTKKFPETPVKDIPMQMYGLMQGDKGLDLAIELKG